MLKARYRRILWFFGTVILSLVWWDIILPRLGLRGLARRTRQGRLRRFAASFRSLAVQMGGVMIKIGQFLSARLDVLPRAITEELSGLQDEVRPEPVADIRRVIEKEFDAPLESKFCWFEDIPLAAASIGQVHRALLCPGEDGLETPPVVVKIQRPNIEVIVETDLSALRVVAGWIQRYPPVRKRANVPQLLREFSNSLYEEIDYLNEGKNAEIFAANFEKRPQVQVPQVYWSHTTRRVLTLQNVQSIKITDYAAIQAAGIDRGEVAERLLDTYLKQIFEDRFFHADPHPGNLFILPLEGNNERGGRLWKLVFVDFGMTGKISPRVLSGLRELLIAVGTQDAARVIKAYQILDVLLPGVDLQLLEKANAQAFKRFWGKSTTELVDLKHEEAVEFAREFGDLLYEMPFQVPEDFILLGRSLGILSGMCTGLNPDFNVWVSVTPYVAKVMEDESGNRWKYWLGEATDTVRIAAGLPRRLDSLLLRVDEGRLEVRSPELRRQIALLERTLRRVVGSLLVAAFLLGGIWLYLAGERLFGPALMAAALLVLIWMWFMPLKE